MSKVALHSIELRSARSSNPKFDARIIVPIAACAYAVIVEPLLMAVFTTGHRNGLQGLMEAHPENRYFWPALAIISILIVLTNDFRQRKLTLPPHIVCFLAYLTFAGVSASWAFKPDISFIRFVAQVMIVTSIILPALLAVRTTDMMHCLFLCFAFIVIVNVFFVLNQTPILVEGQSIGYPGYFPFKGTLGECAAIAFLLSLHEILYPGLRRALGIVVIAIAIWLTVVSMSKGSLGLGFIAPLLAALTLVLAKSNRVSPAIVLLAIFLSYIALSALTGFTINKLSWHIYGNYTFSGRTLIWDFAHYEIDRRPLLGWGYQSFWLVGPDGPSVTDAWGWIKEMPSAHSGYLDTRLEMGYVGFVLLVIFLIATLHAVGRVADRDRARAWLLLSLALYVILTNFLETTWMRGAEPLWMVFVIVTAEIARYWHPFRPDGAGSISRVPGHPSLSSRPPSSSGPRRHNPSEVLPWADGTSKESPIGSRPH